MALTLVEAAKLHTGDVIRSAVIEEFARSSDLMMALPFQTIAGNALKYTREYALPGIGFRGLNEAYPESVGIVNPETEALTIAGGDLDVDKFIVDTMGADQRATQEMMKVKALSLNLTRQIIKGDSAVDPRGFDGLQKRVTGSQLIPAGNTAGGDALSLTVLDRLIDAVDMPTHLLMSKSQRRIISAAARDINVGGYISYQPDAFGRRQMFFNDIPILVVDYDTTGVTDSILPYTEACPGGGTTGTSIYCVALMDGMLTGLQNADMSVRDLGELQTKPAFRTRVEWFVTIAILNGRSAARLYGLKDALATK